MTDLRIPVYAQDRKTILSTCSIRCTSVGAAKAAKVQSAYQERINGQLAWVTGEPRRAHL